MYKGARPTLVPRFAPSQRMQSVISRVHRLVTAPAGGEDAGADVAVVVDASPSSSSVPENTSAPSAPAPAPQQEKQAQQQQQVVVTAEIRLAGERLQFAMLLGERKKAVAALHALATSYAPQERRPGRRDSSVDGDDGAEPVQLVALGQVAVPVLLSALVSDPRDTELMEAMLELLQLLVTRAPSSATALLDNPNDNVSKSPSVTASVWGIEICLQLLQDPSPWIRGPAIALVRAVQRAQPRGFASAVLECKEGLRRVLEVVEDRREHIRDAALQVLAALSAREKNAQQFLAFEDGFARLFQIMEAEGLAESSSVVSDCLQIVNNMLRDNYMTQTLFLELPFLESHVPALLRVKRGYIEQEGGEDEHGLAVAQLAQRKRTLKLALQLVRFLVAGLYEGVRDDDDQLGNRKGSSTLDELARRDRARKQTELSRIQSLVARQPALMGAIAELACITTTSTASSENNTSDEVLADIQLQALDLLELLSTGNGGNQIVLVNLRASPRKSVLAELVRLDVALDESPVAVAATSLLDALFRDNESAKMALLQHVHAPPPVGMIDDGDDAPLTGDAIVSAGRVLLDALVVNAEVIMSSGNEVLSPEDIRSRLVSVWKASHRLATVLTGSEYCKELALRLPSQYEDPEAQSVAGGLLLSRLVRLLTTSGSSAQSDGSIARRSAVFQVHVAVIQLLVGWCRQCPKAVAEIVGSVSNLSILLDKMAPLHSSMAPRARAEHTQIRGLVALLLGSCLEFLVLDSKDEVTDVAGPEAMPAVARAAPNPPSSTTSRGQLLDIISKRVGLAAFTDALVQFQQSPAFVTCARGSSKAQSSRMLLRYRATYDVSDHPYGSERGGEDVGNGVDDAEDAYLFLLYDKAFTLYYRDMAGVIQKRILSVYTTSEGDGTSGSTSTASSSGGAHAIGAYQDLIRMQDKQIHELEQQLKDTKQALDATKLEPSEHLSGSASGSSDAEATIATMATLAANKREESHRRQVQSMQQAFDKEKEQLGEQIREASDAKRELETRLRGLTMAFEELEREHQQRQHAKEAHQAKAGDTVAADNHLLGQLRAELEAESRARRELEQQVSAQSPTVETIRLRKEMEELRMQLEDKQDDASESRRMLEALSDAQSVLKKENEALRSQLDAGSTLGAGDPSDTTRDRSNQPEILQRDLYSKMTAELQRFGEMSADDVEDGSCDIMGRWHQVVNQIDAMREQLASAAEHITEFEQVARAAYEQDKRLLETRILEVESARQQVPLQESIDVIQGQVVHSQDAHSGGEGSEHQVLKEATSTLSVVTSTTTVEHDKSSNEPSASAVAAAQLVELQELRSLLGEVESTAKAELATRDATIGALQERVARFEAQAQREKDKFRSTVGELEDELARAFLARKEVERKSKAAVKELENEVARLFLSKVEMEKQLGGGSTDASNGTGDDHKPADGYVTGGPEEVSAAFASDTINIFDSVNNSLVHGVTDHDGNGTDDDTDLLVMVASLEIECAVLRERLDALGGAQAVDAAAQRSKELGAVVITL